jgi:hypothetical protein
MALNSSETKLASSAVDDEDDDEENQEVKLS